MAEAIVCLQSYFLSYAGTPTTLREPRDHLSDCFLERAVKKAS
jgi:hypothetical protein